MYSRQKSISDIKRGYRSNIPMTKKMKKLRDYILRINKKSRKQNDTIQDKYKFKCNISHVANVPETYFIEYSPNIKTKLESIEHDTFVLKPNHLSRGIGVRTLCKKDNTYHDINGSVLTVVDLIEEAKASYEQQRLHIKSIKGIMAERRLISHDELQWYAQNGIADIRMIFFKHNFLMGLGRFPTIISGEYGNISRGAKWGIFDALGKFRHDSRFVSTQIPNQKKLPFFREMRDVGSSVVEQYGYQVQAVDMTVDRDGKVYVIESERTPQFELYLTKEGIDWMWGIVTEQTWDKNF